jgi:SAM-dependent methyltransferase
VETFSSGSGTAGAASEPERFEAQARGFDARAGLPAGVPEAVAKAVLEIAGVGPEDLLVELGAGTGEIGQYLIGSIRYVGIDRSRTMLELFGAKLASADDDRVRLSRTDADQPWPVADASAAVVFASRVAHLLDGTRMLAELQRVLRSGGHFLLGRVIRDPAGAKSRLRRRRQLLLGERGVAPRDAEKASEHAIRELVGGGAVRVEPRVVATWTATASVGEILDDWREVGAMGGKQLSAATRDNVLTDVEAWAARELGDPDEIMSWDERYEISGARMPDRRVGAARAG